jgi:hypothetical protein
MNQPSDLAEKLDSKQQQVITMLIAAAVGL